MQSTIITRAIKDAVKILNATGVQYKVIDLEGNEYGNLQVAPPPKPVLRKAKSHRQYGELQKHFRSYVENLAVGQVASVPLAKYKTERQALRAAAAAWCSINWGNESYKTCITDNAVEILRLA